MIEQQIEKLFHVLGLGEVIAPIESVSGGFMHRMYKVTTKHKSYAVKYLNPNVMSRPDAATNFQKAETLEKKLEEANIPIVPALVFDS